MLIHKNTEQKNTRKWVLSGPMAPSTFAIPHYLPFTAPAMKKFWTLFCLLALGFTAPLLQGCQKDADETPPPTTSPADGPLIARDNVVVVDSVRHRLDRTPALLAAGTYRFTDSGGPLSAPVGSVIVGDQGWGFLRKVTAVTVSGNQTTLQTEQASLDDVFSGGTLKLNISSDSLRGKGTATQGFVHNISNVSLPGGGPVTFTLRSGRIELNPNWNIEAGFGPEGTLKAEVAARGGTLTGRYVLNVTAGSAGALPTQTYKVKHFEKKYVRYVPVVILAVPVLLPVVVKVNMDLELKYSALVNAGLTRDITVNTTTTFDAGMAYANGRWQGIFSANPTADIALGSRLLGGTTNIQASLGPKVSFQFYDIELGPYVSVAGKGEVKAEWNGLNQDWNLQVDAWLESRAGVTGKILGKKLPDYYGEFTYPNPKLTLYKTPASLELTAGNNQTGPASQALPTAVKVRVLDSQGNPELGVRVTFAPAANNGSVSPTTAVTDANGYAQTTWTLGSAVGTQRLSATAKLANGQAIAGAPIDFAAVATPSTGCLPAAQMQLLTGGNSKTWQLTRRDTYSLAGALTGSTQPASGVTIQAVYSSNYQYTCNGFTTALVGGVDRFVLNSPATTTAESFCPTTPTGQIKFIGYGGFTIDELTATRFVIRVTDANKYETFTLVSP